MRSIRRAFKIGRFPSFEQQHLMIWVSLFCFSAARLSFSVGWTSLISRRCLFCITMPLPNLLRAPDGTPSPTHLMTFLKADVVLSYCVECVESKERMYYSLFLRPPEQVCLYKKSRYHAAGQCNERPTSHNKIRGCHHRSKLWRAKRPRMMLQLGTLAQQKSQPL